MVIERIISKERQKELQIAAENAEPEKKIKDKIRELAIKALKKDDPEWDEDYN